MDARLRGHDDRGGSISFLITGDEEGPSVNGTRKVLEWMAANGHRPDHCLVGEPSNPQALGDAIKIGRRGSLSARLTVTGRQGHSAYPQFANNPVPGLLAVLNAYLAEPLDHGSDHFEPSYVAVTGIDTGNPAFNVIPERISAQINVRFNDHHDAESLRAMLSDKAASALAGMDLRHTIDFEPASHCFLTRSTELIDIMAAAVEAHTGRRPALSTGGGTSDARFIKDYCPVIEFGLVNKTIHGIDERVAIEDLHALTAIYRDFIARYFEALR
jgi:succinyl-diaminopimelate desuccinylase